MQDSYKGRYKKLQRIGAGNYGEIFKVKREDGQQFIAKHINLQGIQKQIAMRQLQILKKLGHPYIVKYVDSFVSQQQLIIIMEYCGEKDLSFHIQAMKTKQVYFGQQLIINWVLQLLLAMECIHRKKILHRDIKPQNIFIDQDMNIKIGDFGISRVLDKSLEAKTVVGTPYYLAPQICRSEKYTNKADIWSLGCVIYELCALEKPFITNKGLIVLMEEIKTANIKRIPSIYSDDLNAIVTKMLCRNSTQRASVKTLLQDPLVVNLMIVNSSKINLKQEYPKTIEKPTFTDSFITKKTQYVNDQFAKFANQVKTKIQNLKQKSVQKNDIDKHYEEVKKKLKEIQKAVQIAFKQLKDNSKESQIKQQKLEKTIKSPSLLLNTIKSTNTKKQPQQSSQSSVTINSIDLSHANLIPDFGTNISLSVESVAINERDLQKSTLDKTLKSQYTNTIHQIGQFSAQTTINRLQMLQATIMKNPEALLNETFMNCTLSLSSDKGLSFKNIQNIHDSITFDFTKKQEIQELQKSERKQEKQQTGEKKQNTEKLLNEFNEIEAVQSYYDQQFQDFQDSLDKNPYRVSQINEIVSFYQQTLQQINEGEKSMTKTEMMRNKYPLALSLIRQQSSEGGSILSNTSQDSKNYQ